MKIAFKPILNLEIWHDYYLGQFDELNALPAQYDVSEAIALVPTIECQNALRNLRWLVRAQPYGAILLAQIDSTDDANAETNGLTPIVAIDACTRLTFWLVVRDRNFSNYTNLCLDAPRNHIYYFSNQSKNQIDDSRKDGKVAPLFLTHPLPAYEPGTQYTLGQLVSYQNGDTAWTLEAAKHQTSASQLPELIDTAELDGHSSGDGSIPRPQSNAGAWIPLPNSQYVSDKDQLPRQGLSRKEFIPKAKAGDTVQFSLINLNEQETFSQTVQVPGDHSTGEPFPVTLNFIGQHPGCYQLLRNGEQLDKFVLFDPIAGRDAFALIEISLHASVLPESFRLLNVDTGTLQLHPKTYRIRFKNRATRWRYRCDRPHGFTAESLPAHLQLIDAQTYATKHPIGLCRQPKRALTNGNNLLPAPSISMIKPLVEAVADRERTVTAIFSDTYL